jgi:hypothetical protein
MPEPLTANARQVAAIVMRTWNNRFHLMSLSCARFDCALSFRFARAAVIGVTLGRERAKSNACAAVKPRRR